MSNIAIRKNNGGEAAPAARQEWEPFRLMRALMSWDPFREMAPLWPEERGTAFLPAFEVKETQEAFVFKADVPGIEEKDLDIKLTGNRLTVTGRREAETQDKRDDHTYFVYERAYGSFSRSFTLPDGVDTDHVRAELKDGVLTIVLPKKPEMVARKIAVKSGSTTKA